MEIKMRRFKADDLDGLRLVALGRIPRCTHCPRYHALVAAHWSKAHGQAHLPSVPEYCHHPVCAPLAVRIGLDEARGGDRPRYAASAS
jgi:hypothetical protein